MSQSPQELLNEALLLSTADRGRIAAELIESLDADADPPAAWEAWSDEIESRLQDMDAGRVTMVPWPEARRRIRGDGSLAD